MNTKKRNSKYPVESRMTCRRGTYFERRGGTPPRQHFLSPLCDGAIALDNLYQRGKIQMRGCGDPHCRVCSTQMPKVTGLEELLKARKAYEH